ncbi:glycoside hydrolase family 3 N-terminal domain-containing protein [Streptomyces sp. BE303]|uniref:glycoside hydrolase family 3 N-terminal domain-containing protein n=1 Tax=Streptomyces sp. BE303 TaxID=3002528 RepID=UPI002E786BE6|nr:glycoside hydrolase family 3 N-terminal domain-containing protein [Streptomyces sp. BE303]MED7953869.1 glycoside hydrolase family 3 N-terminal domain-containing protein [Streptomyces sp. BE303]
MPTPRSTVRVTVLALLLTALSTVVPAVRPGPVRSVPPPSPAVERAAPMADAAVEPVSTERTAPVRTTDSRTLAGRRVVYSYPGPIPPPALLQTVREGRAAGVILFKENAASPAQLQAAVRQLSQAAAEAPGGSPLLLMTDQEGGKIRRLPGAPELSARRTGLAADPPAEAARSGTGAAQTLAAAGLNVNLAPVLDVYDAPDNFIDHHERSYSQDPAVVGELGAAYLAAQQALGVAATAKHFPGLGAAAREENTDERPVTLPVSLVDLRERGLAPYRAAIAAGVRLVMTSWAVYPALDPGRPAGLSSVVVQGELRARLGFEGVTVTDALEAGALAAFGDTAARTLAAAEAGMDLLLCSARDVHQGDAAAQALAAALDDGRLDRAAFTEAVGRVDALRTSLAAP